MITASTDSIAKFHELLIRNAVSYMSNHLLGMPYSELMALIYPRPPYKTFTITKRNGSPRIIHEPRLGLKVLQEKALAYLYRHAGTAKPCVHGFTPERSIVTNAKIHCSPKTQYLLNVDIQDFFPSITFYRVRGLLQKKPFEFSYQVATVLAHLCTFNGLLPQGAPTSPLLANLTCRSLDRDLMALARRHRATYTRYADDITFSFSVRRSDSLPSNICSFDSGILTLGEELRAIFASNSFRINPNKSRLSTRLHRLEVTGITINQFPNVKRAFIDRIRGALHAWETYGYDLAQAAWKKSLIDGTAKSYEKRPRKRQMHCRAAPALQNVLWGKLLYVRMVRGGDDLLYIRLAKRYNALCESKKRKGPFKCSGLPVDAIVRNQADAEDAVFVIEWMGDYKMPGSLKTLEVVGGQGTAFAYKDVGLITCNHVLSFSAEVQVQGKPVHVETDFQSIDVVSAVLTISNPATGESWPAKVVHRDANHDLAVIQFDLAEPPSHHYFIGLDQPIQIRAKGVLIGFPYHSAGRRANFLDEKVLNRYPRFGLERFDIAGAGSIRQGNSGGPFVDEHYRVAGVAQQGARQDYGNDECLCVTILDKWLSVWKMTSANASTTIPPVVVAATATYLVSPVIAGIVEPPIEPEAKSTSTSATSSDEA